MSPRTPFQAPETFGLDLAGAGFWVFPTTNYNKGARSVILRGEEVPWGDAIHVSPEAASRNRDEIAARLSIPDASVTGYSLLLQPTDPVPLCIIDVDPKSDGARSLTPLDLWALLFGQPAQLPGGLGVVRTPSGGTHFYFTLPRGMLPGAVAIQQHRLADGLYVDTRVSGGTTAHLMLPGSRTTDHSGPKGVRTYELLQFPPSLTDLEPVPEAFAKRLVLRAPIKPTEEARIPTEVSHLLNICKGHIPVEVGNHNNFIAAVGQTLGRLDLTWDGLPNSVIEAFWQGLGPKVHGYDRAGFIKTFRSGYKTGRQNAEKHGVVAKKRASLHDVLEEFRLQFGGDAWVKELISEAGRSQGFRIGVGGTAETPEQARYAVEIDKLIDLNGVFAALVSTSPDTTEEDYFSSPFFTNTSFRTILLQHFRTVCRQERLGMPIEDLLLNILGDMASMAADEKRVRLGISDGPALSRETPPFLLMDPKDPAGLCLVVPSETHCRIVASIQPTNKAQRLFTEMAHRKRERRVDTYRVSLKKLPKRVQTHVMKKLRVFITEKAGEA